MITDQIDNQTLKIDLTGVIDVALAGDWDVLTGLAISAYSAIAKSSRPVRLWLILDRVPRREQARLKQCWQRLNNFAGATFFEMRDLPLPMPTSWSRKEWPLIAAARFQLPLLIPATTSRCIYLDTDILVDLDIAELVDHDLHGTDIAMVVDRGFVQFEDYLSKLGLSSKNYGNTGVVLIDLDSWRKQGAASGLIDMGMNMPTDLWFFDQDILNVYFKDRCTWLSTKWNVHQAGSSSVGCIRHFTGRVKPWHVSAAITEDIAFTAWHHILERSGYITKKTPRRVRLYKRFSAVFARAQRKLSTNRFDATPKVPHKP